MIHTYRDEPRVPASNALRLFGRGIGALFTILLLVLPIPFVIVPALSHGLTWTNVETAAWAFGVTSVVAWLIYRYQYHCRCREIRLSDDGTCELQTKRRSIHIHVSQITSVERWLDEDGWERYTIRFQGGRVEARADMTNFSDFLTRLKDLNPGVHVRGF